MNQKQVEGRYEKKNDGVAAQSIGETFPSRGLEVFLDGQSPNVSHSTAGEIARAGMVNGMFPFPVIVGGEGKQACNEAERVVHLFGFEKGAMPAVVKNNEGPNEYKPRKGGKQNRDPPTGGRGKVSGLTCALYEIKSHPKSQKGPEGVEYLPPGSARMGFLKFGN